MDNRYKIVISSRNIYKEIELSPDMRQMKVGTGLECDVRLHKNLFFGQIELLFTKTDGEWTLQCSDNLYITVGDIRKLMTKKLSNGDLLEIKYLGSDNTVFFVDFLVDFDDGNIRYERVIDTYYQSEIRIGCAPENHIILSSGYVKRDGIVLTRKNENYVMNIINSSYGVLHNGKRAESGEIIKNGDFISISDFFFCIKDGRVWTQIKDGLSVNSIRYSDRPAQNGYPKFKRSTRIKTVENNEKIEILDPPAIPEKPKSNLLTRLLPSMGMLVAAFFMASRGGSMIIFSLISGLMSIVTAVVGVIEGKKEYKTKTAERIETYNAYIERKKLEIEDCREEELESLNGKYLSQPDEIENFNDFSTTLFDRRKEDEDFLFVRLGTGSIKSGREINYKKQEKLEIEDDLQKLPAAICEEYKYIEDAPIICNLKSANAIGIVGEEPFRFDFLKNIVVDIAARQYESDAKMIFVAEPEHKERVYWFRFLPQVYSGTTGSRTIVTNDESKNAVFEYLYKELTLRQQNKKFDHHIMVFVYDEYGFQNHPISKFVDNAGELGVTFVFFGETASEIPMGCSAVVNIIDAQNAELLNTNGGNGPVEFEYPRISDQEVQEIIDILAPVYTEEISLEGTLTKNISMFELLNIIAVDDIDLAKRWAGSAVTKSLAAPLGVSKSGTVYLDLHDKAHGPHGLVAGTTGSGKSEILQTYVLAMATLFHPYEVGFVIIDFKGGGMVNQFRDLPHLVGAITNIDGKQIDRSLKSIKAELQKRQRYFADADVNHIDKYIAKFKKGEVDKPLPHLIIIVDEFAELKAEQPEFMKELISAARIGRSLGVHLILATQKPSGQVNEQIWSNSRFKLCLKVQSQEDSNEVLKSPLAAEIKEPGRAYLQVGNNEIFELFQSAYSGAPEKTDDSKVKAFTIYSITEGGKRVPVYTQKKSGGSKDSATQLDAIVGFVARYCRKNDIARLPEICLPALEKVIAFPQLSDYGLDAVPIGLYDNPSAQYQGYAELSLCSQNILVVGAAGTGKTNLVQVMIRMAASKYSPKEIGFYIADFGSMYLMNYEGMNHVGGVVTIAENEKFKNLFKLLVTEIQLRKEKFQKSGLSSFESYKEAGNTDLQQIVFVIENFSAFKEVYGDQYEDQLLYILREGISCGVTVVITNLSTAGLGYKFLSNIPGRVAFRCNDTDEYSSMFDRCKIRPDENAGRMLCAINNEVFEAQSFLAFEGEKEYERSEKVKAFVAEMNSRYEGLHTKKIPCVPDKVTFEYIEDNYTAELDAGVYPMGLEYSNVDVALLDTSKLNELCIVSNSAAKKLAIAKKLLAMLKYYFLSKPARVYIIDTVQRPLKAYADSPLVHTYTADYSAIGEIFDDLDQELESRYDRLIDEETEPGGETQEQIVVLINNNDAIGYISENSDLMRMYRDFTKKYSSVGVCFWFTNIEDNNVSYSAPELLRNLKEKKQIITEGNLSNMKFCDISSAVARKFKLVEPDDVFLVTEADVLRIKMAEEE